MILVALFLEAPQKFKTLIKTLHNTISEKDRCGAILHFKEYGNRHSPFGLEIDHVVPVSKGGGDELSNLQALHWENN